MFRTTRHRGRRLKREAAAQAAVFHTVDLACGHRARDVEPVTILPSHKVKFDCPQGCGLQAAE